MARGNRRSREEIERLRGQAYELSLRELSAREIATKLNIDKDTAAKYVREEKALQLLCISKIDKDAARAEAIARKQGLLKASWRAFSSAGTTSLNRSAYLGHIRGAQNDLDKLQGVSIDRLDVTTDGKDLFADLRAVMLTPVQVIVSDGEDPFDSCEPTP